MNLDIRSALNDVLSSSTRWKHATTGLYCFYPMQGATADGRLMLVGRALYGWSTQPFTALEMQSEERRQAIIDNAFKASSGEKGCFRDQYIVDPILDIRMLIPDVEATGAFRILTHAGKAKHQLAERNVVSLR